MRHFHCMKKMGQEPVNLTLGSGCLARDAFLVISEGDYMLTYIFVIFYCWALYYTALAGVGH